MSRWGSQGPQLLGMAIHLEVSDTSAVKQKFDGVLLDSDFFGSVQLPSCGYFRLWHLPPGAGFGII